MFMMVHAPKNVFTFNFNLYFSFDGCLGLEKKAQVSAFELIKPSEHSFLPFFIFGTVLNMRGSCHHLSKEVEFMNFKIFVDFDSYFYPFYHL